MRTGLVLPGSRAAAARLGNLFATRYRRHLRRLQSDSFPFAVRVDPADPASLVLLVIQDAGRRRALVIPSRDLVIPSLAPVIPSLAPVIPSLAPVIPSLADSWPDPTRESSPRLRATCKAPSMVPDESPAKSRDTSGLAEVVGRIESRCRWLGARSLTMRHPIDHPWDTVLRQVQRCRGWGAAERTHSYYRKNVTGISNSAEWLGELQYRAPLPSGFRIAPWRIAVGKPRDQATLPSQLAADVEPIEDFEPEISVGLMHRETVVGWMLVSRRRRGLLYNRLFVVPRFSRLALLGARLTVAALANHEQREPGTAAFAHVRTARRNVARLYRRLLSPWCDEFEDNWVAFRPLDCDPPIPS